MTEEQIAKEKKYQSYAKDFFNSYPSRVKVIIEEIEKQSLLGSISVFVNSNGLEELDKQHMAAIHVLARDLGYKAGAWKINYSHGTATMRIVK